jgi:hypothetical protein
MSAEGFAKLREMALELFPVKDARRALFLFSILPKRLVYSVEVTGEEVRVFAVLHDLSAEKDLKKRPVVSVSMKELCRKTGVGETLLRRRLKRLAKTGWIDIIRPGFKQISIGSMNLHWLIGKEKTDSPRPPERSDVIGKSRNV